MNIKDSSHTYQPELSSIYPERLAEEARVTIQSQSAPSILSYGVLFSALVIFTDIYSRHPKIILCFGAALLGSIIFRAIVSFTWQRNFHNHKHLYGHALEVGLHLSSLIWGLLVCWISVVFELSWTSFLGLLFTVAIAAGHLPILAPNFRLLQWHLVWTLIPSLLVHLFFIYGLRGFAMAVLLGCLFFILVLQGRLLYKKYWEAAQDRARLHAMIDAMPGTLSWVSSDLRYLGVNRMLARLWGMKDQGFLGQQVGFKEGQTDFVGFTREVFENHDSNLSAELDLEIAGVARNFYLVGQRYNRNTEAVILGLDVTDYKRALQDATRQKAQAKMSYKMAFLGETASSFVDAVNVPLSLVQNDLKALDLTDFTSLQKISGLKDALSEVIERTEVFRKLCVSNSSDPFELVQADRILAWAKLLCEDRFLAEGIELRTVVLDSDVGLRCQGIQILEVLLNLLNNAYDATVGLQTRWVSLEARAAGNAHVEFSVTDSGYSIADEFHEKIFDLLFSTKADGKGSGVGLYLARQIIEHHGGSLVLDAKSSHTRFVACIPKVNLVFKG